MKQTNLNKKLVVFLLTFFSLIQLWASSSYYFYVQFTDKNNSPYSLSNPTEFLSQRALDRRISFGVDIDSLDLPVNPIYLSEVEALGIHVHSISKWMNGATVLIDDSSLIKSVRSLPYVKFVQYTGKIDQAQASNQLKAKAPIADLYGSAAYQINQLSGRILHNKGYRAKGIHIAVLDAGFMNVDVNRAFDSLRLQGRLLGTKDIIEPTSNIFAQDSHGANVLSIMASNLPGQYVGTAPAASYWLIRTENAPTEYLVETDFWVTGIEFADSVGVDVVNSSLGYFTFDDTATNFRYDDMNGKVSRASIAANLASKKGMLVVVSAGNEGNKSWHYIGSPADAEGILAIGAVRTDSIASNFSSFGPSSDKRVKPELCALGTATAIVNTSGSVVYGDGTSYASPVVAGIMACLLQSYKTLDASPKISVLLQSVISSGSLYNNPTAQMGYGIPDFSKAESYLSIYDSLQQIDDNNLQIGFNELYKTVIINFIDQSVFANSYVNVYAISGQKIMQQAISKPTTILNFTKMNPGVYCIFISQNGKIYTRKILIK